MATMLAARSLRRRRRHFPHFASPPNRMITNAGAPHVPHVPVLIVGAGPVGLVLSFLLTKFGVRCAVLEKNLAFSQHPQAHFINNRSMELFRKLDGLADEIQTLQPPMNLWRKFIYCTSLSGSVLASVDHMQSQGFDKIPSPVSVAHFSQYKLVKLLLTRLKNLGFCISSPEKAEVLLLDRMILMGHECVSLDLTDEGVKVGVALQKDGKIEVRDLHCNFLIGSDGARSTVRNLIGIDMKGQRDLQKLVSVHFRSRDLGQYLLQERPGMLFFIFNPEAIGVLVAHDLNEGEFVLQVPYYPPQQRFEDFSFEVCEEIISKLAGWKPADLQVADVKPWVMHAEVAENYVSGNNRVILVGDSAHRFPPAGGFGMNTGIQDAHNLAWKISSIFSGISSPSLIQTYEMERRPIAVSNTELSVRNFKAAMLIPAALGLDPTVANSVHRVINNSLGSFLPSSFQKAVLEGIFSVGRAQLSNFILNENNPVGSIRLANLRRIIDEGKSLQLQFPAEDLGFCYREGALIADTDETILKDRKSISHKDNLEGCFSARPGSRLPHVQVRALKPSDRKDPFSTLDLIPGDRLEFLFIIAPKLPSYDLARTALRAAEKFKVPLKVCIIWPQGSSDADVKGSEAEFQPWKNYIDVEEVHNSSPYSWWDMCNMTTCGVILVRPDDHIAWQTYSDLIKDSSSELERVFSKVLRMSKETR